MQKADGSDSDDISFNNDTYLVQSLIPKQHKLHIIPIGSSTESLTRHSQSLGLRRRRIHDSVNKEQTVSLPHIDNLYPLSDNRTNDPSHNWSIIEANDRQWLLLGQRSIIACSQTPSSTQPQNRQPVLHGYYVQQHRSFTVNTRNEQPLRPLVPPLCPFLCSSERPFCMNVGEDFCPECLCVCLHKYVNLFVYQYGWWLLHDASLPTHGAELMNKMLPRVQGRISRKTFHYRNIILQR